MPSKTKTGAPSQTLNYLIRKSTVETSAEKRNSYMSTEGIQEQHNDCP